MHCQLGKWWSRTAETWGSCSPGLKPIMHWCSVSQSVSPSVRLSAGPSVSRWLHRGKKSWPPPAGSPFDGPLSTSPCTAALPSGAFSHPLFFDYFLLCWGRYHLLSLVCKHTRAQGRTQCIEKSKPQWTAGIRWCTPKQLKGRLDIIFSGCN